MLLYQVQHPLQNDLRWLLRRGSPLPIPNREVKPACADGTAILWESMSLPFLVESPAMQPGFLVFIGAVQSPVGSCRRSSSFSVLGRTEVRIPEAHRASSS